MTVVSRRGDEGKEGGGCRGGGGAKREARATTRAQVFVARGHVKFAEGSVQSVIVDPCSIPKGPVSGLDHHWALTDTSSQDLGSAGEFNVLTRPNKLIALRMCSKSRRHKSTNDRLRMSKSSTILHLTR